MLDRFVGPGATPSELALQFAVPLIAAVLAQLNAARTVESWSWLRYAVCGLLALDLTAGVITNATSSAKRWYHRSARSFGQQLGFVALHLSHLVVVSLLYLDFDLAWIAVAGAYLLAAAALVLSVPRYLERPVSLAAYIGALVLSLYGLAAPLGLEWFLPLLYLKLLVSHLPTEEPYRPD
jgi:intracellular septation protein A